MPVVTGVVNKPPCIPRFSGRSRAGAPRLPKQGTLHAPNELKRVCEFLESLRWPSLSVN